MLVSARLDSTLEVGEPGKFQCLVWFCKCWTAWEKKCGLAISALNDLGILPCLWKARMDHLERSQHTHKSKTMLLSFLLSSRGFTLYSSSRYNWPCWKWGMASFGKLSSIFQDLLPWTCQNAELEPIYVFFNE